MSRPRHLLLMLCSLLLMQPAFGQESQNPHGDLGPRLDCQSCHTTDGWTELKDPISFNHNMATRFPLTGSHTDATCTSCHLSLRFDEPIATVADCTTCHVDIHQGELGTNCSSCHVTTTFQDVQGIDIHNETQFPLAGAHMQVSCESCHTDDAQGAFTPLPTDCLSCHAEDYEGAQTVDHVAAGFPSDCESCHNPLQWQGALFDHASASDGYALIGAHDFLACASCHQPPDLAPIFEPANNEDCITCHTDDYEDEHGGSSFPVTCLDCHNQITWDDAVFDHTIASGGFELIGAHEVAPCASCHTTPDFGLLFHAENNLDCIACHQSDYDEEHAGSGFPIACLDCHNVETWDDATFTHEIVANGFRLLGAHEQASCETCHSTPDFAPLFNPANDLDCISCHQDDYNDEHAGSGFPTTCLDCHNTNNWDDATFTHETVANGFRLLGAHEQASCETCHSTPDFAPLFNPANDLDCISCHQGDYNDEHAGSGFPTTCLDCHNTNNWDDANFTHETVANGFRLLGAHEQTTCNSCHSGTDYAPLFNPEDDQDCITCHQTDYDAEHGGTGFPITCVDCHDTNNWDTANLNHDAQFFPIFSGTHQGVWNNDCQTCHVQPDNFAIFSCITCHEHNQNDMADEHRGVNGYAWDSSLCYSCHPNGQSD